jgi:hypothetical protein
MTISITTILITGVFFLLIFLTGFGLRRTGQPYPVPSVTIHKFLSLGLAAFLIVTLLNVHWADGAGSSILAVAIGSGVLLLAAIITGGLRSINKPMPLVVKVLHWATPFLSVITTAWLFSLLMR